MVRVRWRGAEAPMKTHTSNGKCKTCGVKVAPWERRCDEHEREYQTWLGARFEREAPAFYKPRYNGVLGLYEARPIGTGNKFKFSRPGLHPGHELRFED